MGKYENFASTLTNNTTYDGEQLESYILKSFTENKTVGLIPATNVVTDIKEKEKVGKLDGSDLVQVGDNCKFNDAGSINVSEGALEPEDFFINVAICYADLRPIYNTLNSGALTEQELSASFQDKLAEMMVSKFNQSWEDAMWNAIGTTGSTALYEVFEGIDTQIVTNAVTGAVLDSTNVVSKFAAVRNALPNDVLEKENLTFFVNQKTLNHYYDAMYAMGVITPMDDNYTPRYMGKYPIVAISKIKDNKIYALELDNIFIGVGGMSDFENMQVLDMKQITGDNEVKLVLQARGDVLIGWEGETAKYTGA